MVPTASVSILPLREAYQIAHLSVRTRNSAKTTSPILDSLNRWPDGQALGVHDRGECLAPLASLFRRLLILLLQVWLDRFFRHGCWEGNTIQRVLTLELYPHPRYPFPGCLLPASAIGGHVLRANLQFKVNRLR